MYLDPDVSGIILLYNNTSLTSIVREFHSKYYFNDMPNSTIGLYTNNFKLAANYRFIGSNYVGEYRVIFCFKPKLPYNGDVVGNLPKNY